MNPHAKSLTELSRNASSRKRNTAPESTGKRSVTTEKRDPDQRTSFPILSEEEAREWKEQMRLDEASVYAR